MGAVPDHAKDSDAVVIGAGAAGGLAALLLAEAGLRVLVLDAGSARSPIGAFCRRLARSAVHRLLGPNTLQMLDRRRQPIQSLCHAWKNAPKAFVDDLRCPYVTPPDRPFVWLRARQLGGRMVIPGHGRLYFRMGPDDFAPTDGLSPAWPMEKGELVPWYEAVERRLGLAGAHDGLPWLPDSELSCVLSPTPSEAALQRAIVARWPGARPVLGRFAPPFKALEAAAATGRLLIRQGAIARQIEVDGSGRVSGVVWRDHRDLADEHIRTPLVFLCASALESTRLLLLSRSLRSPGGLGAASGVLGRCLMDHVRIKASGMGPPLLEQTPAEQWRCLYLPRWDSRDAMAPGPGRGFAVQLYQRPATGRQSRFSFTSFAEMLPRLENRVTLDPTRQDAWDIPVLRIDCTHSHAELARACEQTAALRALAKVAGVTLTQIDEAPAPPGSAMHECGTARMGSDPTQSVLDPFNQCWEARGLYVTDAACFPSQGTQNPTLTILALTARACDHSIRQRAATGQQVRKSMLTRDRRLSSPGDGNRPRNL
jgi:choline dehydrogenase-like flavoprotein